jgi:rhodanese-related sulfurtransferase
MGLFGTKASTAEVSPSDAHALAEAGSGIVVDVREAFEWMAGHAAGATHIPLNSIADRVEELPRDQAVLLICASGNRSMKAARYLESLGFDARSVAGGTSAWARQQLPLEA